MSDLEFESAAKKILGKDGKLPKPRVDPRKSIEVANKAVDAFKKNIGDLEKGVLDLENAFSTYKNTFQQYSDIVDGANFGLDEDDPDDKKKIAAAIDAMQKGIDVRIKEMDGFLSMLRKLDQIIGNLRRLEKLNV